MQQDWIFGANPVSEAIKAGRQIKTIYIHKQKNRHLKEIVEIAGHRSIQIRFVERDFFDTRFQKGHQGIAANVTRKKLVKMEDLLDIPGCGDDMSFFLILDCIEDPRNFGAILRVADATGIHGVVFQSRRSAGITPVVVKASAGAVEHVNLVEVINIKHSIGKMKESGILIVGAEVGSEMRLWDVDMNRPLALVIGSEGRGLRRTVKDMCDLLVTLPMKGEINSLNVSVAAGILSYEVMRQRTYRLYP